MKKIRTKNNSYSGIYTDENIPVFPVEVRFIEPIAGITLAKRKKTKAVNKNGKEIDNKFNLSWSEKENRWVSI